MQKKLYSWKSALECDGLKNDLMKTKVMVIKIGQTNLKSSSKKVPCGMDRQW